MRDGDLKDRSDAPLVVAVGRWNEAALAELYRRHGGSVHTLARRVTGRAELADEVTQEVFTRLWRDPDRFDPAKGSLRSFLVMQAHRRSVDMVRSEVARQGREERSAEPAGLVGNLDLELNEIILTEQVRSAIDKLPASEREPIQLAYFEGHTYREVAVLLGQPEGTIKGRIRAGLSRLRENLTAAGVGLA